MSYMKNQQKQTIHIWLISVRMEKKEKAVILLLQVSYFYYSYGTPLEIKLKWDSRLRHWVSFMFNNIISNMELHRYIPHSRNEEAPTLIHLNQTISLNNENLNLINSLLFLTFTWQERSQTFKFSHNNMQIQTTNFENYQNLELGKSRKEEKRKKMEGRLHYLQRTTEPEAQE